MADPVDRVLAKGFEDRYRELAVPGPGSERFRELAHAQAVAQTAEACGVDPQRVVAAICALGCP